MFLGEKDDLAVIEDGRLLAEDLPNVSLFKIVDFEGFTHMDFSIAIDADKLIYIPMIEMMKNSTMLSTL